MHCVCEMLDLQVLHLSFDKHSQTFGLLCCTVVPSHSLQGSALPKQYYSSVCTDVTVHLVVTHAFMTALPPCL